MSNTTLNAKYLDLAAKRLAQGVLPFVGAGARSLPTPAPSAPPEESHE